jgi:ABC-type transport system involved in multi-copper enzyme maturation permease subunit
MGLSASLRRLRSVAYNTYLESVRQRLFVGVVFFAFLLMVAALVLKDISVHQDKKIIADIGLGAIDFFGTIIAIFIGADLVGRDVERRTLHLLLVKPLRREEFIVGRYLGLCLTILTSMILMAIGLSLALWTVDGSYSWSLLSATYALFLQLCLTGAIGVFFSTTTSRVLAILGATIIAVLGRMTDVLKNASLVVEGFPDWLGKSLYLSLPNLLNFDLKNRAVYGDLIAPGLLADLTLYAGAYVVALLALGAITFRRRDLK